MTTKIDNNQLQFRFQVAEDIGLKRDMEDAHFYINDERGILAGVFDGHGGSAVADYAAQEFPKRFFAALKEQDAKAALANSLKEIHKEVAENNQINRQGSTAIVTYIDAKTSMIYTATLGDSEAHIYRGEEDIKISENPNWGDESEYKRMVDAGVVKEKTVVNYLKKYLGKEKDIRSQGVQNRQWEGINISRTLGDVAHKAISHEPLIREESLSKGDIIVLSSDGLTDLKKAEEIGPIIRKNQEDAIRSNEKLREIKHALDRAPSALEKSSGINQEIDAALVSWEKIYLLICLLFQTIIRHYEKNIAESLVASVETKQDNITALVIEVI